MSQVEEFLRFGKRDLSNHSIIVTELDEDAKNDSSSMWKAIKQTLSFDHMRFGKRDLSNHSIIVTELDEDAKNDSSSMWKAIKQTLSFDHMDTNAILSYGKPHIIVLLILLSILISISRTLEDILQKRFAMHRLHFRKIILVLTTSN